MYLCFEPDDDRRIDDPTPDDIRAALYPDELYYGETVELHASNGDYVSATSSTDAYAGPEEEAKILLGWKIGAETHELGTPRPRSAVVGWFQRFARGDASWLADLRTSSRDRS